VLEPPRKCCLLANRKFILKEEKVANGGPHANGTPYRFARIQRAEVIWTSRTAFSPKDNQPSRRGPLNGGWTFCLHRDCECTLGLPYSSYAQRDPLQTVLMRISSVSRKVRIHLDLVQLGCMTLERCVSHGMSHTTTIRCVQRAQGTVR
jgi:hypothetical protein